MRLVQRTHKTRNILFPSFYTVIFKQRIHRKESNPTTERIQLKKVREVTLAHAYSRANERKR
jgi:hypothetical protein